MSWRIFFKLRLFSLINEIFKISNFEIVTTSGVQFMTKTGPKIVRFWWKLVCTITTLQTKIAPNFIKIGWFFICFHFEFRHLKLSDFNKIWCDFGLKCGDCTHQFSSKSDHFLALFWPWIAHQGYCQPQILIFSFTYHFVKMGWVWKKSVITLHELILHCSSNFRVGSNSR